MRLTNFNRLVGNVTTKNIIMKSLLAGGFPQASCFTGSYGTGKSSSAEISALRLVCENPNGSEPCGRCNSCTHGIQSIESKGTSRQLRKVNLANIDSKVDVRQLIVDIFKIDTADSVCVRILEEAHTLDSNLQAMFLEELERMPENMYVMFVTSRPEHLLPELRNRLIEFKFNRLSPKQISLLVESECSRLNLRLSKTTKNLIKIHSKGIGRTVSGDIEFISSNMSISEDDFNAYFGDLDFSSFRIMLKSSNDVMMAMQTLDSILENCTIPEFIDSLKDYLMECAFLSKDLSFRETYLSAEDKRFAKSLGFSSFMKMYSKVTKLPYKATNSDLQYLVIDCISVVGQKLKTPNSSTEDDPMFTESSQIEVDSKSKKDRNDILLSERPTITRLDESSFAKILDEGSTQN